MTAVDVRGTCTGLPAGGFHRLCVGSLDTETAVSYTHLTLPTIYSV